MPEDISDKFTPRPEEQKKINPAGSRIEFDSSDSIAKEVNNVFEGPAKSVHELEERLAEINTLDEFKMFLESSNSVPTGNWSRSTESMVSALGAIKTQVDTTMPSERRRVASQLITEYDARFPKQGGINDVFRSTVTDYVELALPVKESGRPATMDDVSRRIANTNNINEYLEQIVDFQVLPIGEWGRRTEDMARALRHLLNNLDHATLSSLDDINQEIVNVIEIFPTEGNLQSKLSEILRQRMADIMDDLNSQDLGRSAAA